MTKKRIHREYKEILLENLKDPEEAAVYLKTALADEDERVFLLALRNVLEAQGGSISELAEETQLNRENLYRMLSTKGNPRWSSFLKVFHAIGMELDINPIKK